VTALAPDLTGAPEPDRAAEQTAGLVRLVRRRHPEATGEPIVAAFRLADASHAGQTRRSGEPYVEHPLAVATITAGLGLDESSVVAALLHDVVEDTRVTLTEVSAQFGVEVARIVDGVTKLDRVHFDTTEHQQAATMRKMLVAIAQDLRVLIIKLADRLHNMRTIAALPAPKQQRIARETLDIYAPLAHRLGMQEVKQQLEDLVFATLHPKRYSEIDQMVEVRAPERDIYLAQVLGDVQARLAELGIVAEVTGRPKHLWSIYEKMVQKERSFDEIFDLVGIRVVVDSVKNCYAALGSIHASWKPVPGRFKDYVAMPKFNLYQSLHTTVLGPQGKMLEVQIRTAEMHARAEFGVAAHWDYKSQTPGDDLAWLSRIVEWQQETADPGQFMANLKVDLDTDEIFVFTPKGEIVSLPVGGTPVDFAYSIHTEVGHACIGARVNGRLVSLDSRLTSGDTVEIFTSKVGGAAPSQDWLKFVVSHRAANKIKQWYTRERREDAIGQGRDELVRALRRAGLPVQDLASGPVVAEIAGELNYTGPEALFAAIGEHHISAKAVVARITRLLERTTGGAEDGELLTVSRRSRSPVQGGPGVHVEGLEDVMVRLSRCCTPVPTDPIIGFVTRGRGVSVHRADCANAVSLAAEQGDRLIEVEWDGEMAGRFVAAIEVKALDRARLLRDVSGAMADHHVSIVSCNITTGADRVAKMRFEFELGDVSHLETLLRAVREIDSVYDVHRVVPGAGS
jgi:GTP diphosphokinase / guanosine-3',5'-bis(diphosphate) 3'-diphosphatase